MTWQGPSGSSTDGFTYVLNDGVDVPRRLSSMHARAICHATEDGAKVEQALRTVVGDATVERFQTDGHFGNPIEVLGATLDQEDEIMDFLSRLTEEDILEVASTLDVRMDDACQVFLRLDKQKAYVGELRLGTGEDVIAVRVKVRAYPARPEIAAAIMKEVLTSVGPSGRASASA